MQMWWNWQTRYFEGVVGVSLCGFKSHRLHQRHSVDDWVLFLFSFVRIGATVAGPPLFPLF